MYNVSITFGNPLILHKTTMLFNIHKVCTTGDWSYFPCIIGLY